MTFTVNYVVVAGHGGYQLKNFSGDLSLLLFTLDKGWRKPNLNYQWFDSFHFSAMTVSKDLVGDTSKGATELGSMLFTRCVSGTRYV